MWESPKTILRNCKSFTFQRRLRKFTRRKPERPCKKKGTEKSRRERREKNGRLPAQMPASRVSKKPGGDERQERKDAVSGREDGNRGAGTTLASQQDWTGRRSSAFGGKSQCVDEQRKSCITYRLARYLFLFPPPPAMLFFHLSFDQRGQYGKCL